jgi:hypothetical protein
MSYAYSFEAMERVFRSLSKRGALYFEQNKSQLRYFAFDNNIKHCSMLFGTNQCQFVRTSKSIIERFEFAGISDDLYCIQNFTTGVFRFNRIVIGNRNFKLFRDVPLEKL